MASSLRPYLLHAALLAAALVLSVVFGSVYVPPATLLQILADRLPGISIPVSWPETYRAIVFDLRLPHTALVTLTGAGLAASGAAYQGLFRNPLADPYLIGVASGAGLGAVAAMAFNWPETLLGYYSVPVMAFLGAALTVFLVYSLAQKGFALPTTTLILAGVAVSSFSTALTSFLMLRSSAELHRALSWLLGGAILTGWEPVVAAGPFMLIGLVLLIFSGHALNVLQFGEEQARQLGLPVERAKLLILLAASLTTGASVAFSGVIGFVGLIIPHLIRIFWGPDYRRLIPLSLLGGSVMLLLADLVARTLLAPQILPVGIITALAGAPFFLWVLRQAKGQVF